MSYRMLTLSFLVAPLLAGCAIGSHAEGSYIASDADTAFMVQIASVADGKVTGTASVVASDKDGKTTAGTRPMSGTIEGNALNLSVENGTGLSLVTGTIDGDTLHLTFFGNGGSTRLDFAKADASKFPELVEATRRHAAEKKQEVQAVAADKVQVEQRFKTQRAIDRLADAAFVKGQELREKTGKLAGVIAAYRVARERSGKMQLAKRRLNTGTPDADYQISQIDYQLGSLSSDAERTHGEVQSYMQSTNGFMADTAAQSSQFLAECQADRLLNCSRLSGSLQVLRANYQQFQAGYERENIGFNGQG